NGQNVPVLLGRIAERLAQDGNVLGYVGFLDKTVRPEGLHQLLFAYHAIAVLNQDQKRVEGLGHERDRLLPAQQEPLARIKPERTEPIELVLSQGHTAFRTSDRFLSAS